jgi:F-type H+-transporting ATPase subunit alpha
VISITDGQIYLVGDLFNSGVRPAVDVGISVSRVGGNAQIKSMKKVAGTLRLDMAQFRELAAFSQFASDLDKASQAQLARGQRLVEVLKQDQYSPLPVTKQIIALFAGTNGFLDSIPVDRCRAFEASVYRYLDSARPDLEPLILSEKDMTPKLKAEIEKALTEAKKRFAEEEKVK